MNARTQRADRVCKTQRLAHGAERVEQFDLLGRVAQTDEPDGSTLHYRYDEQGQLAQVRHSGGERVDYRRTRDLMAARTERCATEIHFSALGFPERLVARVDGHEWSIEYRRNEQGAVLAIRYPDAVDWLEHGAELRCGAEGYARFAAPDLELANGASAREVWIEGAEGAEGAQAGAAPAAPPATTRRLQCITHRDAAGAPCVDLAYSYDAAGRVAGAGNQRFEYDAAGRLARSDGVDYEFDADGRLRRAGSRDFDYAAAPSVARAGDVRFEYDALGRRRARHAAAGTRRYDYNLFGQLAQVTLEDGATVRYLYDGFGRLVGREDAHGATYYVVDFEGRRIADAAADGTIVRSYLWHGGQCIGAVDGACGAPLAQSFHRVHGGTLAAVGDARGRLAPVPRADPYGADSPIVAGVPGYASLFGDPLTGLLHAGSRWLDPEIGQFVTPDSWLGTRALDRLPNLVRRVFDALPGGTAAVLEARTAYDWCGRDPVNFCDPNGHNPVGLIFAAMSSLIWSMQMTSAALQMEVAGLALYLLLTFPGLMFLWANDFWHRSSPFNAMAPINASYRLMVPIAFPLNSMWNGLSGRAFTLGNVIFTNGASELEKTSQRDLIECANAATYIAAAEEAAADTYRARSPHARGTATVDGTGGVLTAVAVVPAAAGAAGDVFMTGEWVSIRLVAGGNDELRAIVGGVAPFALDRPLPAGFFNQPVTLARLDDSLVRVQSGDVHDARTVKFVRGKTLHIAAPLPATVPTSGVKVTEYMPAADRGLAPAFAGAGAPRVFATADAPREHALVRVAVAADLAAFAANDFVRIRAATKQAARVVARRRGTRDLILDTPLPAPARPADYRRVEIAKLTSAGAPILNQTATGDRVKVGNIADLRKGDGLVITAAAPAAPVRRIVEQVLLECPVVALPALLHGVKLTVDLFTVDTVKQAGGKNPTPTLIETTPGQAGRFSKDQPVRVRKAPDTDFFTTLTAVDAPGNKLTLKDPLPVGRFPANGPVTVNLLNRTKGLTAENSPAPGTAVTLTVDQPFVPAAGELLRVRDKAATQPAEFRKLTAAPTVIAQVDSALPPPPGAPPPPPPPVSVERFTPVAASVKNNASAPLLQLHFQITNPGPNPFRAGDELHFGANAEAYGKVVAAPVGAVLELEDPVEAAEVGPLGIIVRRIAPTGQSTNDAKLLESLVMIPSDPGEELVTRRRALQLHEMRHVWQYALLGPFFFCLPIPWLVDLGFSDGTSHDVNKYLRRATLGVFDTLFALVWGIGADDPFKSRDAVGAIADAGLKTVQFPADADIEKIKTFTAGAPCEITKDDYQTYNTITDLDVAQRRVTLRFSLESDKFAQNDNVGISVSPFEKMRAKIHDVCGLNLAQAWAGSLSPGTGQMLARLFDRDSWLPGTGLYFLNWLFSGDQHRIGFEQDASFQSGDLYDDIAIGSPTKLFVGQFARVFAFIKERSQRKRGVDVAEGVAKSDILELLTVEPKGGGTPTDHVFGSVPSATGGRVRFRERFYIRLQDRVENAVGAFFAAAKPGEYVLHAPQELADSVRAVLWIFGAGFHDRNTIQVEALKVSPAGPLFETETLVLTIKGDSVARYTLQYQTGAAPAPPLTFAVRDAARVAVTVPLGAAAAHQLEIKATYQLADAIFHGPGQLEPQALTAADVSNVCQQLTVNVQALTPPVIAGVQAGKKQTFQMPIAPASVRVTTPVPAGAAANASVVNGTGRPATLTFVAPNKVTAATDVTFDMVFGAGANRKVIQGTVHVTP